ncbi:efflux RND transporter periplasmic adaptor subunit, partial [Pseudophaeobacter sp.]
GAAQKEIEHLTILAPFDGLLESDSAELGSLVLPGDLCATVIQLDTIKVVGFVPETQVNRVDLGALAQAELATGDLIQGKVTFVSRSADQATRTFEVEITVANPDLAIRDGQTADIAIAAAGATAHKLPQSALTLNNDGQLGVRTVEADMTVGFTPVELLRDEADGVWVDGLPEQAEVIITGQDFVTTGVAVTPSYQNEASQ